MNVKLTAAQKNKTLGNEGIAEVMQRILKRENKMGRAQEHFWIVGMDNANKILFVELLALGTRNRLTINPPETYRMAIYKLAARAVLVHNHPSGVLTPSKEDIAATDYLAKAGEFLKIEVLDHIIISEQKYFSFAAKGLMAEIYASPNWRIERVETKELEDMRKKGEAERNKKETQKEIGKKMKDKGISAQEIKELTGLKLTEIKKL